MNEIHNAPATRDLMSVGSRVSWGAILAGSVLALGLHLLLSVLGAAVGLTVNDRLTESNLRVAAVAWWIGIACVSLFMGGLITALFTVGESKVEALVYGVLMWALTLAILMLLGGAGVRSSYGTLLRLTDAAATNVTEAELVTRITWYVFAGTWASMVAAALGGFVGAGPTFRVVTAPSTTTVIR